MRPAYRFRVQDSTTDISMVAHLDAQAVSVTALPGLYRISSHPSPVPSLFIFVQTPSLSPSPTFVFVPAYCAPPLLSLSLLSSPPALTDKPSTRHSGACQKKLAFLLRRPAALQELNNVSIRCPTLAELSAPRPALRRLSCPGSRANNVFTCPR